MAKVGEGGQAERGASWALTLPRPFPFSPSGLHPHQSGSLYTTPRGRRPGTVSRPPTPDPVLTPGHTLGLPGAGIHAGVQGQTI